MPTIPQTPKAKLAIAKQILIDAPNLLKGTTDAERALVIQRIKDAKNLVDSNKNAQAATDKENSLKKSTAELNALYDKRDAAFATGATGDVAQIDANIKKKSDEVALYGGKPRAFPSDFSKSATPELRYGKHKESLVPGTAAYEAATAPTPKSKLPTSKAPTVPPKTNQANIDAATVPPKTNQTKIDAAHTAAEQALVNLNQGGQYAIQMGLINSDPSLKELFYKDVYLPILNKEKPVEPGKFQADLLNTTWYKTYDSGTRAAQAARTGDPATWSKTEASATQIIKDEALAMGYNITSDQLTTLTDYALNNAGGQAENINGLVLTQLRKQIANTGKFNPTGGAATTGMGNIKSTLGDYGIAHLYSDQQIQSFQDRIEKGTLTQDSLNNMIKEQAKSAYQPFANQIDSGFTIKDIVSPYLSLYGKTLELNPNATDISDPNFANSIFSSDVNGNQIAKPLWQYQVDLKKDPRWAYTDNARNDLSSVGKSVLQDLGLVY